MKDCSEIRFVFFEALKINQSLTEFHMLGNCNQPCWEEEEYFKECLLENSSIISIKVPWKFEELQSILERNAKIVEEKRFKTTKLAAQ